MKGTLIPLLLILLLAVIALVLFVPPSGKVDIPSREEKGVSTATSSTSSSALVNVYHDEVYGFSFSYPEDWYLFDRNEFGSIVFRKTASKEVEEYNSLDDSLTPEQDGVIYIFPAELTRDQKKISKEEYIDSIFNLSYETEHLYERNMLDWNGRDVIEVKETYTGPIAHLGLNHYYHVFDNDKVYVFRFGTKAADQKQYEKDLAGYRELVQSLSFASKSMLDTIPVRPLAEDPKVTSTWSFFESENHGFSFKYPPTWQVVFPGPYCDLRIFSPDPEEYIDVCWSQSNRFRGQTILPRFSIDGLIAQWHDVETVSERDVVTVVEVAGVQTRSSYSSGFWRIELHAERSATAEKDILKGILSTLTFS